MRLAAAAIVGMSLLSAAPAIAITIPLPPPLGNYDFDFEFDGDGNLDLTPRGPVPVLETGPGLIIRLPSSKDLHLMQIYSVGGAEPSLVINGNIVTWTDVTYDLYNYYNLRNFALLDGDNIFVISGGGGGLDSTLRISGFGGAEAVPAPAALPLMISGLAGLAWLRRRKG